MANIMKGNYKVEKLADRPEVGPGLALDVRIILTPPCTFH